MQPPGDVPERLKIGVLIPSTNTVVEPEFFSMLPAGVTAHAGRMLVSQPDTSTDALYKHLSTQMLDALEPTVSNLVTCLPGHLALCMSAMAFGGGTEGDEALRQKLETITGIPVSTGPSAMMTALRALEVGRVIVLSPFQPAAHDEAVSYFEQNGIEAVGSFTFMATSTIAIAKFGPDEIRAAIVDNDLDRADAIIQVGTNMRMARLAAAAEWWLGKPVLHINTVMAWNAMRSSGIPDRVEGFGSLLSQY